MASAGFDCRLLIWDLEQRKIALRMDPLPQPVRLGETEGDTGVETSVYEGYIIIQCIYNVWGDLCSVQCIGIHCQDRVWEISAVYSLY